MSFRRYLVDTLTEPGGEEEAVEAPEGLFPRCEVGVRQDLEGLIRREESRHGGDVVFGEDRQCLERHCWGNGGMERMGWRNEANEE